jgi:hypothetical protein
MFRFAREGQAPNINGWQAMGRCELQGKKGYRMVRKLIFAAAVAGLLVACGESRSYPLSADEVTSKLLATRPSMLVIASPGVSITVSRGEAGAVRWTVLQNGNEVMRLVATVTPDGETGSSVAVSAEPLNNHANTPKGNMADNPAIVNLYRSAMVEQIDARLSDREFDVSRIRTQMSAAAAATEPGMRQSAMQAARNPAEKDRDSRQRAADEAYEREQHAAMSGYSSARGSDE